MKVYVVTGLDLGWDCVVGVFTVANEEEYEALCKRFPREIEFEDGETSLGYHIHEQTVEKFDLESVE